MAYCLCDFCDYKDKCKYYRKVVVCPYLKEEEQYMNQEYIIHKELKDMLVYWFEDIEELSSKLTSGNVSHQGATIRNKAIRCSKFIKEFCKTKEDQLWHGQQLIGMVTNTSMKQCQNVFIVYGRQHFVNTKIECTTTQNFPKAALRSSSEENYPGTMSQQNLNNYSL